MWVYNCVVNPVSIYCSDLPWAPGTLPPAKLHNWNIASCASVLVPNIAETWEGHQWGLELGWNLPCSSGLHSLPKELRVQDLQVDILLSLDCSSSVADAAGFFHVVHRTWQCQQKHSRVKLMGQRQNALITNKMGLFLIWKKVA